MTEIIVKTQAEREVMLSAHELIDSLEAFDE